MVRTFSLRSTVHLLPLKSKRVSISRRMPWMALSTSAISVLEPMSKEGTRGFPRCFRPQSATPAAGRKLSAAPRQAIQELADNVVEDSWLLHVRQMGRGGHDGLLRAADAGAEALRYRQDVGHVLVTDDDERR